GEVEAYGSGYWYLADRNGSVRDVMAEDGTVVRHRDWGAFGAKLTDGNDAFFIRYGWQGSEQDAPQGLYHLGGGAFYHPATGTTADGGTVAGNAPLGAGGLGDGADFAAAFGAQQALVGGLYAAWQPERKLSPDIASDPGFAKDWFGKVSDFSAAAGDT